MYKKKVLYIAVGLPGSGKTTFLKEKVEEEGNICYVSRDEIRFSLLKEGDDYFKYEKQVYEIFIEKIANSLLRHDIQIVCADATHLTTASRKKLLFALSETIDLSYVDIRAIYFDIPLNICIERNNQRSGRAKVPTKIIENMFLSFEEPSFEEDFSTILQVNEKGKIFMFLKEE